MKRDFLVTGDARPGTVGLAEGSRTHPEVFRTNLEGPPYVALHGGTPRLTVSGSGPSSQRSVVTDWVAYSTLFSRGDSAAISGDRAAGALCEHEQAVPKMQYASNGPCLLVDDEPRTQHAEVVDDRKVSSDWRDCGRDRSTR